MIVGIVSVMEVDMVAEQLSAYCMMGKLVMHQHLAKRHDQMCYDGSHDIQWKLWKHPRYYLDHGALNDLIACGKCEKEY